MTTRCLLGRVLPRVAAIGAPKNALAPLSSIRLGAASAATKMAAARTPSTGARWNVAYRSYTVSAFARAAASGGGDKVAAAAADALAPGAAADAASGAADAVANALAAADAAAEIVVAATPELVMYRPTHLVMSAIENIHVMGGIPYWEAIVVMTLMLRLIMLPLAVQTMQNAMRMAVLRPHMQRLQDVYLKDPHFEDMRVKLKYQSDMKALFVQHKVNPFRSLLMPLFQLPVFISFFLGLQGMGEFFPALATGGALWFTDLSAADPYFIFPVLNAVSFLVMIEMGADRVFPLF